MKTINEMIETILSHEGGYVNNPGDKGGPTNYGITMATYSAYYDRPVDALDIKNMDITEAKAIYENDYFIKPKINTLPESVQPVVFDMCVNHGNGGGVKLLQQAFNNLFGMIAADGGIGPITQGAITSLGAEDLDTLINEICTIRVKFYKMRVEKDETQWQFLKGWTTRADSFRV